MIGENIAHEKEALLSVSQYQFNLLPVSPISLSINSGSTLRGGFGNALKEVCCTVPRTLCSECTLFRVCAYPYLFETPVPINGTRMTKGNAVPRPFVIEPPLGKKVTYESGETMTVGLVLIGKAIESLPYFIRAFEVLGERGIGMGRGNFQVKEVQPIEINEESVTECGLITLRFLTPTRIVVKGRPVGEIDFSLLFRTLVRRIENLRVFHGLSQEKERLAPPSHAEEISVISRKLRWVEQERYSRRQKQNIPQGGFVGEICFEGDLEPFLTYLRLGEAVHVGKGATFGMGRFEVVLEEK